MPTVMPVMISGKQGSGKSSISRESAELLAHDFRVVTYKFAEPLYKMQDAVLGILSELDIPVPQKDGHLLQLLGTEWGRQHYGQDIWVKCAQQKFKQIFGLADRPTIFLIDDLRFKNEFEAFGDKVITIRLEADRDVRRGRAESWRDNENHPSEVDLDDWVPEFDAVFHTDRDQSALTIAKKIQELVVSRQVIWHLM